MTEYDGPAFNQNKELHSLKNRRFNQFSQREVSKTHFEPALKDQRKVFPLVSDSDGGAIDSDHQLFPTRKVREKENGAATDFQQYGNHETTNTAGKQMGYEQEQLSQLQQIDRASLSKINRATPQADYDIPFLKNHDKQIRKLDQASLENAMFERQTSPMSEPAQPNRPERANQQNQPNQVSGKIYPPTEDTRKVSTQVRNETSKQTQEKYETDTKEEKSSQAVFQPTELPKPYRGNERRKEDVEEIRELAKRLVKTKDTFLLFDY